MGEDKQTPAQMGYRELPGNVDLSTFHVGRLVALLDGERLHWWLLIVTEQWEAKRDGYYIDLGIRDVPPSASELTDLIRPLDLEPQFVWRRENYQYADGLVARLQSLSYASRCREEEAAQSEFEKWTQLRLENVWMIFLALVAAVALLASIGDFSSGYYTYMRWLSTPITIALAILAVRASSPLWLVGVVPTAVLWNFFIPIYLDRSTWLPIDLAGAAFYSAFAVWVIMRRKRLAENVEASEARVQSFLPGVGSR
jgi:hypothetical protein